MDSKSKTIVYEFLAKRPDICQNLRLHLQEQQSRDGASERVVDVARTLEVLQDVGVLSEVQNQLAAYMHSEQHPVPPKPSGQSTEMLREQGGSEMDIRQEQEETGAAIPSALRCDTGIAVAASSPAWADEDQPSCIPDIADTGTLPYLLCRFCDGHGFAEYEDQAQRAHSFFVVHVSFGNQRFRSRPVEVHRPVKLHGIGAKEGLPIGELELEIQLLPRREEAQLSLAAVESQLRHSDDDKHNALRQAMSVAESWWNAYKQMHHHFRHRLVKIFAKTEFGEHLPVNSFVCPLSPRVENCSSYALDSPFHCARFVATIETETRGSTNGALTDCGSGVWSSWHALFARGAGTVEDHATLLCSLLLGFSMDAWVAVGLLAEDLPYCWVITRDRCGDPKVATFWDACTGQRLASYDPAIAVRFASVHCVFNHTAFYACCSVIYSSDKLHYHFEGDESMWWKMPEAVFNSPHLKMEDNLRHMIENYRRSKLEGMETQWDDVMSTVLSLALSNYETERTIGVTFGDRPFRDIIKGLCQTYTFKACPLHFTTGEVSAYFGALLNHPVGRHILELPLGPVKSVYGLRCKIFKLPEDQISVWVILAVRHYPSC
ncbi:hypothetical protein BESB_059990 [Besnoitia besnoiti]|uniref:Centrosomal of 76 kDa protein n=1 Tax=Besnoitia besnoiti TaxID=94643 RepID=A0A2A9MI88_BESBE|nr:hypothetical protein BESB_059990 [Besnoitia besnoiti]PFH35112.1 hypothetical protein BESB_059990 [Besnoitia besnoiti]